MRAEATTPHPPAVGEHQRGSRHVFAGRAGRLTADTWRTHRGSLRRGIVLFLHGGGQTRHAWYRAASRVARAGWDAVSVDTRGHGDSDWARDGDYSMDALIDDLADVVAQLRERPVMVGASMGGMTALMGEGERGNLARGLVLVDVTPTLDRQATERIRTFMTAHPNGFPSLEAAAVAVQDYRPGRTRPANPDGLRKNLRQRSDGRWYWHWDPAFLLDGNEPRRRMSSARSRAAARALTVPTLLVRGAESDVVTTTTADELLQLATHAQYVDVPGAGHMVAGDDNEIFADHVVRFLGTVSAATGQRNTESEHPTQLLTPSGRRRRRSAG